MVLAVKKTTKLGFLILLLIPCWVIAAQYNIDLVNLYAAAKMLLTQPTLVYTSHDGLGRWFYGPVSLVMIKPFAYFPYVVVKYFWIVLQTISFFAFWRLLGRLFPFMEERTVRWGWLFVWVLAINPIHNNFQSNNIQLMLATVLLWAETLDQTNEPLFGVVAGFLCAICAAIKVFPLFLCAFYFVARSRWVKTGLLTGFAAAVAVPYAFFGKTIATAQFKGFFENLTTYNADNSPVTIPDILCLPSMIMRWLTPNDVIATTGQASPHAALAAKIVILALSAIFFYYAWRASRETQLPADRRRVYWWALAMALMAFLNPSTRPHYFIFYIPAYAALVELSFAQGTAFVLQAGLLLSGALVALTAQGILGKTLNDRAEAASLPTYGALILCVVLAWVVSRRTVAYVRAWKID